MLMEEILGVLCFCAGIGGVVTAVLIFNRIHRIEGDLRTLRASIAPGPTRPAAAGAPLPQPPPPPTPAPSPVPRTIAVPPTPAPPAIPIPLIRAQQPSRTREEWEILLGGRLLNRIGALALILGVGFFLKYAFDNSWITETGRVVIGAVTGALLLAGGARSHARGLAIFAQGLISAGIAILYLSVYASFNFYHLVPQLGAFALMTAVTTIAFQQAFRYDSLAIALLAWAGGFLTPIVLSTGVANEFGLFTYLALLDAGILVISLKKPSWNALEPLALVATWTLYTAWFDGNYAGEAFSLTLYFVVVFWALFHAIAVTKALQRESTFPRLRQATAAINATAAFAALSLLCDGPNAGKLGTMLAIIGILYAGSVAFFTRRNSPVKGWIIHWSLAAASFIALATSAQWEGFVTANLWTLEAIAAAWLGRRWGWKQLLWFSLGLFFVTSVKVLATHGALALVGNDPGLVFFNRRGLTYAILAVGAWIAAPMYATLPTTSGIVAERLATGLGALMGFILLTVEASQQYAALAAGASSASTLASYAFQKTMTLGLVWTVYGGMLAWVGHKRGEPVLRLSGVGFLALGLLTDALRGVSFEALRDFMPLLNWRVASMLGSVVAGIAVIRTFLTPTPKKTSDRMLLDVLRVLCVFLLFMLVTGETKDFYGRDLTLLRTAGDIDVIRIARIQQMTISAGWLLFSFALMGVGIWRRSRVLRFSAMAVFGITTVKLFIDGVQYWQTLYGVFTLLAMGGIFLAVSYAYQKFKQVIMAKDSSLD
jgi:uncharacterized membrane protein